MAYLRLEDLHPAVVADDPVGTDEKRPPGADRNAGDLPSERDDLLVLVIAEAVTGAAEFRVYSEKRITVGPEPANVYPRLAH